ncbi:MAG: PAS domain S-box protein [candidate division Zixibacteria bacterium]|nr:PAS domain S-box protein [candidate division Zixibacteria bacterium]
MLKPLEINEIIIIINQAIDKVKLEEKLKTSESVLNLITNNIPDILYSMNLKGEFININHAVEACLGYKPSELLGISVFTIIHPDDQQKIRKSFI